MANNSFGNRFTITTYGERYSDAMGVIVDGCPSNINLKENDILLELHKVLPNDKIKILSGVFKDKTLGSPISIVISNKNEKIKNYEPIKDIYRPGHSDFTYDKKYGIRDYREDGRASLKETYVRVIAGTIAKKILGKIKIYSYTKELGGICAKKISLAEISRNKLHCPDKDASKKMEKKLEAVGKLGNTLGGVVEIIVKNVPIGLGDPLFNKLDADLSKALFSIGNIKGIEFGIGFESTRLLGSVNNDEMILKKGKISFKTNNAGGMIGGISNGEDIIIRVAVKPLPSVSLEQSTVDKNGNIAIIDVKGQKMISAIPLINHVCESMVAIVLADHILSMK